MLLWGIFFVLSASKLQLHLCLMTTKKILCYPHKPKPYSKLTDICRLLALEITNDPEDQFDLAINWNYKTTYKNDQILIDLDQTCTVLNFLIQDVSKSFVDDIFSKVFGYTSLIDPDVHHGHCVRKSERQAAHDGQIIPCPTGEQPGYIYQRLIDNRDHRNNVVDYRFPIFNGNIPFIYFKHKKFESAFGNNITHAGIIKYQELWPFTQDEVEKIILFAEEFGLDYGEIDVLRNNSDGRIYILDVNNIAGNAIFNHLARPDQQFVRKSLSESFNLEFLINK